MKAPVRRRVQPPPDFVPPGLSPTRAPGNSHLSTMGVGLVLSQSVSLTRPTLMGRRLHSRLLLQWGATPIPFQLWNSWVIQLAKIPDDTTFITNALCPQYCVSDEVFRITLAMHHSSFDMFVPNIVRVTLQTDGIKMYVLDAKAVATQRSLDTWAFNTIGVV